jgi:hypothetical protein
MNEDKDKIIQELKEQLQMEKSVKDSEVLMNANLKEYNEKLQLTIDTLLKINEDFLLKISNLKFELKRKIDRI